MKVVAVVPMKLNNERLKGKNTKSFDNGKPLCSYILETLQNVKEIDEIYVYCSDESICEYLPYGVKFLKRSTEFDSFDANIIKMLQSFAALIPADCYVLAHVTAPFLQSNTIATSINSIVNDGYDSALSVVQLKEFIWKDNMPFNYNPQIIPRTQDLDQLYCETTGMYIYTNAIIQKGRRVGFNPYLAEVSKVEAIDINSAQDFYIANAVYNFMIKGQEYE